MKKTRKLIILFSLILALLFAFAAFLLNPAEKAFADGTESGQTDAVKAEEARKGKIKDLLNSANTYNCTISDAKAHRVTENSVELKFYQAKYDFENGKNAYEVSSSAPQVTFLTHGLGGSAAHWSNKGNEEFDYNENSIIEKLQQVAECNVYWAEFKMDDAQIVGNDYDPKKGYEKFILHIVEKEVKEKTDEDGNIYSEISYNTDTILADNKITDNSKHSIVVFSSGAHNSSNDYVYAQFNYMASTVVSALRDLDVNGKLPRVNLIGHSRGGLTNLQYALDHPDLVDSIFSLGTPYMGSTSASLDYNVLQYLGLGRSNYDGEKDIADPDIYGDYLDRWNAGYDYLYSNIKVHAIGAYESLDMLVYNAKSRRMKYLSAFCLL